MASQIDLGAVVPIGKGDWNSSTTYERTNIVRHNSTAWVCKVDTSTGVEPTEDSSDWYLLVKDTSSVTSINGMKGDVTVNSILSNPSTDDDSLKIASTSWVKTKVDNAVNGVSTEISQVSSTANIALQTANTANSKADNALSKAEEASSKSGKNVGDEWHSFTGKIPAGGVPYCGQMVTRAAYTDLWTYAQNNGLVKTESKWQALNTSQNGNVPFYSDGDGSSTFRMPKVVGYIKGTSSLDESGVYTAEGLPDPTLDFLYRKDSTSSGVLAEIYGNNGYTDASPSDTDGTDEYMQSSLAFGSTAPYAVITTNNIYGNSAHVTPETVTILFGVYAYGEVTVTGSTTTDKLATGLANVESRLSTLEANTEAYIRIIEMWESTDGKSWYREYSDGWVEQGGYINGATPVSYKTITYPKAFATKVVRAIYNLGMHTDSYVDGYSWTCFVDNITKTTMNISVRDGINGRSVMTGFWYACGY